MYFTFCKNLIPVAKVKQDTKSILILDTRYFQTYTYINIYILL